MPLTRAVETGCARAPGGPAAEPATQTPVVHVLARVSCFASLSLTDLQALAGGALRRRYDAGQVVLLEGAPCGGLYVVEEGWLKIIRLSPAGREQVIRTVGPGEHFNEISVFAGTPNSATVIALEPVTAWAVTRQTIFALLDTHPAVARSVIESLARSMLEMVDLVEDLSLRTVEARLARLLVESAEGRHGVVARASWATQAEMAARLGTVPDVLNRALRKLADEGLIEVKRRYIQVLDREALRARATREG